MKIPLFKFPLAIFIIHFSLNISAKTHEQPLAYVSMPSQYLNKIKLPVINKKSNSIVLNINPNTKSIFNIISSQSHSNGDKSFQAKTADAKGYINATVGKNSIFGQMHIGKTHYIITTEGTGSFVIELPQTGLDYNDCSFEHNIVKDNKITTLLSKNKISKTSNTVIDFLILYSQDIADRYPRDLLQTRLNQYFNLSNQIFANSNVDLTIRLVGKEQVVYKPYNSNFEARNDLQLSLTGAQVLGLGTAKRDREFYGADMVVLMRPHNIETRGSCGIAFFPTLNSEGTDFDPSYGVHIMSDGMSSWSICTDQLLAHELGHNLGAGHNDVTAQQRFIPAAAGFAKLGQFATVMGSFGTGRPERFLEIDTFSNPNIQCGGVACGSVEDFNNVNVINQMKDIVANYQPTVSTLPVPNFSKINPDKDSDGVIDWDDPFPFDPTETSDSDNDGVGDNTDAFVSNAAEQYDFDADGIGNNEDKDDDNDGVDDNVDAFPFNTLESIDSDGDGIGDNADLFPNDILEQHDYDADGMGDNQDSDDDNDGFIDFDFLEYDLLIINTGSNQILRFDAKTGDSGGIEIVSSDGILTFQSDLAYKKRFQLLYYTSSSSVKQLDLNSRNPLGVTIPPYSQPEHASFLNTGFPTSLMVTHDHSQLLYVSVLNNIRPQVYTSRPNYFIGGDQPLIDGSNIIGMISKDDYLYYLDQSLKIYYGVSFSNIILNNNDQNWMADPYALAIGDNNRLFVTNQESNKIETVDVSNGNYAGMFANIANFGYSNPTGIVVTDENTLLVAASDQNAILKFNAETGEFLGELVKGNGLDKPHKMILVSKLYDRFHHDIAKVIKPNAGLWYNPETNGRGFDIQVFNNRLSVIWYTFDDQGLPTWYISSGELNGFEYNGSFDKTHLNPDGSFTLESVGSVSIDFSDERNAQINWQINSAQGSEAIVWLVWSYAEEIENYTGLWGRPDGPGWGVSVATIGKTSIAIPYIYDSAGEPRWLISNPVNTTSPLNFDFKAIFSDSLCPSCSGVSAFTSKPAGTMTLGLTGNKTWNSNIQFPAPVLGEWLLDNTELKLFSSEATRPR